MESSEILMPMHGYTVIGLFYLSTKSLTHLLDVWGYPLVATAELFFQRHGDKTVFFGRHLAVLRAWAAFLAGMNRMSWQKFLLYNAAGGILWAGLYGMLGRRWTMGVARQLPTMQCRKTTRHR